MKKYLQIIIVVVLLSCTVFGCGKKYHSAEEYQAMREKHPAVKTYRDGMWKIRYNCWTQDYSDRIKSTSFCLSVDVLKDMTEEDMLDIMDYYEFTKNAQLDMNGNYMGERETDYTCYAAFYKGETDELIRRIKYYNGKEIEVLEEDKYCFATPGSRSSEDEIGEEGINGQLP